MNDLSQLAGICGADAASAAPEARLVYARDASRIAGRCLAVVWPSHAEQVAALVAWAGRAGVDLTPRGAGTGLCGGATPQDSVVVDFSRMTGIRAIDLARRTVTVGPGVVLEDLNRRLERSRLRLPVVPGSHRAASIGGMIATDAAGLRAVRHGSMRHWVKRIKLIDGQGDCRELTDERLGDAVGREGATGLIIEATLHLTELPGLAQVWLEPLHSETQAVARRDELIADPALTALEYLNAVAAAAIGWPARPHLLVEREAPDGPADATAAEMLWRARDGLYPLLARAGHPVIEDPCLNSAGLAELLPRLADEGIPVFGHLGVGIIHPCYREPDDPRIAELYTRVAGFDGAVSGEHGIGLKKQGWMPPAWRAAVEQLKATYDPQRIINRGKSC